MVAETGLAPVTKLRHPGGPGRSGSVTQRTGGCVTPSTGGCSSPPARLTAGVCIIHLIRNTFRYASRKYWDKISIDLRPIYTAATATEARRRSEEFAEKWGRAYPAIKRLWDNAWEEFIPFLDYGGCRRMRSGQCSVRPRSSAIAVVL